MSMNKGLKTVVAAMVLGLQLGRAIAAEPSLEQLAEIETLLSSNDVEALRSYLELHPELLEGETQLALLLRRFLAESANLTSFLGYSSDLRDALDSPESDEPPVDEFPDPGEEPTGGGGDPGEDPDSGGGEDPDGQPLY